MVAPSASAGATRALVILFSVRSAMVSLPWVGGGAGVYRGPRVRTRSSPALSESGRAPVEVRSSTRQVRSGRSTAVAPSGFQMRSASAPNLVRMPRSSPLGRAGGECGEQDEPLGRGLDQCLDEHGGQGVGRVGVVDVPVRVVAAHQGDVEEVPGQDVVEGGGHPLRVPQPGGHQGVVEVAVCRVVLRAAQFEGAMGRRGEVGGVVGVDLVERPDAVEMAEVAVVVGVVESGTGPLGERALGVDPVRGQPVGERTPALGVRPRVVGGGRAQGVPGRGEVHGGVQGDPSGVRGPVLRGVGRHDHQVPVVVGPGEEVLVEAGDFGECGGEARVASAAALVVVHEGLEQPVRAAWSTRAADTRG